MNEDNVNDLEFLRWLDASKQEVSVDKMISDSLDKIYNIRGAFSESTGTQHPLEHISDETVLLQKRKQLADYQIKLDERRVLYTEEIKALEDRETILASQRKELEVAKQRFTKFIQENNEKKETALHRMHEEYSNEEQLRMLQAELLHTQEGMAARFRCLKRELSNMSVYEDFLQSVTQASEEFTYADQILHRYANLKTTHAKLMEQASAEQLNAEKLREKARAIEKMQAAQIYAINSETSNVIKELEIKERDTTGLSAMITKHKLTIDRTMANIGVIILGIDNLYLRCLATSKIGREYESKLSILDKLQIISEIVGDMEALVEKGKEDGLL